MYRSIILFALLCLGGYASAHQFTPTYPDLETSYVSGVKVARMSLFNSRQEIDWYSIGVYDQDWNSVAFASTNKLINLPYLERKNIEVYIRKRDAEKVAYICSKSKILSGTKDPSIITSRICSKIKSENDANNTTTSSMSALRSSLGGFELSKP